MQEYIAFLMDHWGLSLIFVAAFVWVIIVEIKSRAVGGLGVSVGKAVELINKEKAKVFDIRAEKDFNAGHIVGAKRVSPEVFNNDLASLKLKKDDVIIIVCMRGVSAMAVVKELRKQTYVQSYVLTGGIHAWKQAEMPVVKS